MKGNAWCMIILCKIIALIYLVDNYYMVRCCVVGCCRIVRRYDIIDYRCIIRCCCIIYRIVDWSEVDFVSKVILMILKNGYEGFEIVYHFCRIIIWLFPYIMNIFLIRNMSYGLKQILALLCNRRREIICKMPNDMLIIY